jgi:DNA primase
MEPKEEIKQRLPIEVVIGEYVELKRAGRNYKGLSPFSAEKTPSFIVSPEKNIWHDFSSGKGGDIFSFVMEVEGMEFPEALKHLASKAGVELEEYSPAKKQDAKLKQTIFKINELTTKYFQASLLKNPEALNYLKERGITGQAIKDFKLGYAPNSPDGLVKVLQKNGFKDSDILKAGVATNRNGKLYDIFRERITFPFISPTEEHLGFTGRLIKESGFGPKYLNTPQTLVYNKSAFLYGLNLAKEAIRKNNQVVLLEGNMDVVASHQAGLNEIVAASGTAITALQVRALQRLTENLIFCLDTDKAGIEATMRSLEITAKTDLKVQVAELPTGYKDPDELLKDKVNGGLEKWKLVLQQTTDAYIWLIETLAKDLDFRSPGQKGSYAAKIIRILNLIENPVSKESYKKYLAEKLDVSLESLEKLAENAPLKRYREVKDENKPESSKKPDGNLPIRMNNLLSLLVTTGLPIPREEIIKDLLPVISPKANLSEAQRSLLAKLKDSSKADKTEPEEQEYINELSLIQEHILGEEQITKEVLSEQILLFIEATKKSKWSTPEEVNRASLTRQKLVEKYSTTDSPK